MESLNSFFKFSGKSTRSEFWAIQLLAPIIFTCIMGVLTAFTMLFQESVQPFIFMIWVIPLAISYLVVHFSTTIRRLNDANINPFFVLTTIIPYIGFIVFIIFGILPSENK